MCPTKMSYARYQWQYAMNIHPLQVFIEEDLRGLRFQSKYFLEIFAYIIGTT